MEIKKKSDQLIPVDISEWTDDDVRAFIRPLNIAEQIQFRDCFRTYIDETLPDIKRAQAGAAICILVLVDEAGDQLLSDDRIDDIVKAPMVVTGRILQQLMFLYTYDWQGPDGIYRASICEKPDK